VKAASLCTPLRRKKDLPTRPSPATTSSPATSTGPGARRRKATAAIPEPAHSAPVMRRCGSDGRVGHAGKERGEQLPTFTTRRSFRRTSGGRVPAHFRRDVYGSQDDGLTFNWGPGFYQSGITSIRRWLPWQAARSPRHSRPRSRQTGERPTTRASSQTTRRERHRRLRLADVKSRGHIHGLACARARSANEGVEWVSSPFPQTRRLATRPGPRLSSEERYGTLNGTCTTWPMRCEDGDHG